MLGIDFVAVSRIEKLSRRPWYTALWLNADELLELMSRPNRAESIAGAIAAKEAIMKASFRGFRQGVRPCNIKLEWSAEGTPVGSLEDRNYAVSITHSDGYAVAVAFDLGETK